MATSPRQAASSCGSARWSAACGHSTGCHQGVCLMPPVGWTRLAARERVCMLWPRCTPPPQPPPAPPAYAAPRSGTPRHADRPAGRAGSEPPPRGTPRRQRSSSSSPLQMGWAEGGGGGGGGLGMDGSHTEGRQVQDKRAVKAHACEVRRGAPGAKGARRPCRPTGMEVLGSCVTQSWLPRCPSLALSALLPRCAVGTCAEPAQLGGARLGEAVVEAVVTGGPELQGE